MRSQLRRVIRTTGVLAAPLRRVDTCIVGGYIRGVDGNPIQQ